jgi:hypothetical protein
MKEEKMVLSTSDEAARHVENVPGWVSRQGRFYGKDERAARYDGCTHVPCEDCGTPIPKGGWTVCRSCRGTRDLKRYLARERKPYEGGMVYSDSEDKYFDSLDDAMEYAEDEGEELEDLRLLLCVPNYAKEIDSDQWADDLPDDADGELPAELLAALEAFNAAIRKGKFILSWSPGKYAVELP